ncbi:MAG: hypothetical protein RSD99_17130, partial [Janthinobacterium sp.]
MTWRSAAISSSIHLDAGLIRSATHAPVTSSARKIPASDIHLTNLKEFSPMDLSTFHSLMGGP